MSHQALKCPTCGAQLDLSSYKCPVCGRDAIDCVPTQGDVSTQLLAEGAQPSIGEFRILRIIGSGGMGTVYEAYQESMHRRVALKVIDAASPLSSSGASRFEREAWIAGSLNHPNIVKVYGQGAVGTTRYIAMELVEGESLAAAIQVARADRTSHSVSDPTLRSGRIQKTVSMFVDLADALQHVHERRIVHRDIKPSNLLFTKDKSQLLLTDFGLARDEKASQLTRRGDFMGTVRYMSPEQLLAQRVRVDHRTDIWSFGVSLYEALTLDLPYSGDSEEAYIGAVSMKDPAPARTRNRAVPRDLETVLMKCLERDPERRYASAGELRADLARYLDGRPVLARRPGVALKAVRLAWRHRLAVGAASIAVILALGVAGSLLSWRRHQTEVERIRWTLQQVINNPKTEPGTLQPDWPHLQGILQGGIRRNPHGDLALLARRAACKVTVDADSYGLLSKLPYLKVIVGPGVDPGEDFVNVVYVEGSLDGGPWVPIGSAACQERNQRGGSLYSDALDRFFPAGKLTAAPHEIRVRANFRLFDPNTLSATLKSEFSKHDYVFGDSDRVWLTARNAVPLFTETRSLEPISINLFTEYPKNFPRRDSFTQATRPPQPWFHLDRVLIVRVELPPGQGTGLGLEWPQDTGAIFPNRKRSYCAPQHVGRPVKPVIGIEFFGRLERFMLAADASIWSDYNSKALLSLPAVWSAWGNLQQLGHARAGSSSTGAQPDASLLNGELTNFGAVFPGRIPIWGYNMADFADSGHVLPALPDGTADGVTSGRIDFVPSRSIALEAGLSSYLGEKVSVRIPSLEVTTIPAQWTEKQGCH